MECHGGEARKVRTARIGQRGKDGEARKEKEPRIERKNGEERTAKNEIAYCNLYFAGIKNLQVIYLCIFCSVFSQ